MGWNQRGRCSPLTVCGQCGRSAVEKLDEAMDERFGKGEGLLIAGVENFDLMLNGVFKKKIAQSQLREWLTRKSNRIMLLATSSTGIVDNSYDERLFQAFETLKIEPWDENQSLEFFNKWRTYIGNEELDEQTKTKARAISTFIGGTPRLAALLGEALLGNDALRSAELLDTVADELTPFYKHRVEVLKPPAVTAASGVRAHARRLRGECSFVPPGEW